MNDQIITYNVKVLDDPFFNFGQEFWIGTLVFILTFLFAWFSYKKFRDKSSRREGLILKKLAQSYMILLGVVFLIGVSLSFYGSEFIGFDRLNNALSFIIGLPAALAGAIVAIILAIRSIDLTQNQNKIMQRQLNFEKEVDARLKREAIRADVVLKKEHCDNLYKDLNSCLNEYLEVSFLIFDHIYDWDKTDVINLNDNFFDELNKSRKSLINSIERISKDALGRDIWLKIIKQNKMSLDGVHTFYSKFDKYEAQKGYLPDAGFLPDSLYRYFYRDEIVKKHIGKAWLINSHGLTQWSVISDYIHEQTSHLKELLDYSSKVTATDFETGKQVVTDCTWSDASNHTTIGTSLFEKLYREDRYSITDQEKYEVVKEIFTTVDISFDQYKEKITYLLNKLDSKEFNFDNWYEFILFNAFDESNSSETNKRPLHRKVQVAGQLLACTGETKGFDISTNTGLLILRNILLLLKEYATNKDYLVSILSEKYDDESVDIVNSSVGFFYKFSAYQLNEDVISTLSALDKYSGVYLFGFGSPISSDFYKTLFENIDEILSDVEYLQPTFAMEFSNPEDFWYALNASYDEIFDRTSGGKLYS